MKIVKKISCLMLAVMLMLTSGGLVANAAEIQPRSATGYHTRFSQVSTYQTGYQFWGLHPYSGYDYGKSSETISRSVSISCTISGSAYGLSASVTKGITVSGARTFTGSTTKRWGVGVYAKYQVTKYKVEQIANWNGQVVDSWYTTVTRPIDGYFSVVYN